MLSAVMRSGLLQALPSTHNMIMAAMFYVSVAGWTHRSRYVYRCGEVRRAEGTAEIDAGRWGKKRKPRTTWVETNRVNARNPSKYQANVNKIANINQCEPVMYSLRELEIYTRADKNAKSNDAATRKMRVVSSVSYRQPVRLAPHQTYPRVLIISTALSSQT